MNAKKPDAPSGFLASCTRKIRDPHLTKNLCSGQAKFMT